MYSRLATITNVYTTHVNCTHTFSLLLFFLIDQQYPFELPRELSALNYTTIVVGKNHFEYGDGKNAITPPPSHGWSMQYLYDGLGDGEYNPDDMATYDDYDRWFNETSVGQDPLATGKPLLDWNSFRGAPYIYNESWHPTAWVRKIASSFLKNYSTSAQDQPFIFSIKLLSTTRFLLHS